MASGTRAGSQNWSSEQYEESGFVRAGRKNLRSKCRVAFSYNCGVVAIAREAISYEKKA